MAEVEYVLHNEAGIQFPPLRPAFSDGELYFGRFRARVSRATGNSIIGVGGTGQIHLVRDEFLDREVALKIPLEGILRDPGARADVIRETRLAMGMTHPNIVRIFDFHEEPGRWGISMQYVRGKNLDEWHYRDDGKRSGFRAELRTYRVEDIKDWIAQLCEALRYAHEDARMVHRDVKPKNLMLEKRDGGEKLYITDFGISRRLQQHTMAVSKELTATMGTLLYMSPEQMKRGKPSPLDDVYAVGATIYELLTGRPPFFEGTTEQVRMQIEDEVPPPMTQRIEEFGLSHVHPPPRLWEEVVAACLAKRPEDRPQSMRELAERLGFKLGSSTELESQIRSLKRRVFDLEIQWERKGDETATGQELEDIRKELGEARKSLEDANTGLEELTRDRQALSEELGVAESQLDETRTELDEAKRKLDEALQGGGDLVQEYARQLQEAEARLATAKSDLKAKHTALQKLKDALDEVREQAAAFKAALSGAEADKERGIAKVREDAANEVQETKAEAKRVIDAATATHASEAGKLNGQVKSAETRATQAEQQLGDVKSRADAAEKEAGLLNKRVIGAEKALAGARAEAEKGQQELAEKFHRARQLISKLEGDKESLERSLDTEKERQGASLRPILISLLAAVCLGLGGGLVWSWSRSAKATTVNFADKTLPQSPDSKPGLPVSYELFQQFAKAQGTTASKLGVVPKADAPTGVNGVMALNFCLWLTKMRAKADEYYDLPFMKELKETDAASRIKDTFEWTRERGASEATLKVFTGESDNFDAECHIAFATVTRGKSELSATFRVVLRTQQPLPNEKAAPTQ